MAWTFAEPATDWGEDVHPDRLLQDSINWDAISGVMRSWTYWSCMLSPPGMFAMVGFGAVHVEERSLSFSPSSKAS